MRAAPHTMVLPCSPAFAARAQAFKQALTRAADPFIDSTGFGVSPFCIATLCGADAEVTAVLGSLREKYPPDEFDLAQSFVWSAAGAAHQIEPRRR